ncbi:MULTISPECIES: LysE family translocator [Pacificibacter]|uniref:LysE family translocator n=1 Tax=Pacificibacter TaxID=1042323 RepID=UPI001C090EAA|nr:MULTISPECIES: LysE family translocator [Pacificibacter]MBU2936208.1 LysE family translocator [Pacificibacter marinus]MDO6616799.1 LysE family translocator [Pacificibacter sp. 1_MG-2023]
MTLAALVAFYFVHLAAAISPGPAVLLAARTALREGMLKGAYLAIGIGLGACFWALAALFGLAILFQVAPVLLTVLKICGGLYLGYLAYKIWKHAPEPMTTEMPEGYEGLSGLALIWLGITTQLANPKPALFFGTIFLTLVPAHPPLWVYPVVLSIIFFNDCGWNIIVSRIFSLERTRRTYLTLKTTIDRVFGGLLAALSAKLVLS